MAKRSSILLAILLILGAGFWAVHSREAADDEPNPEEKAVLQTFEAMAAAFNKADAKALANLWSESAAYLSAETGQKLKGRKAIEKDYQWQLAGRKKARLEVKLDAIRILTPEVATVDGSSVLRRPGQTPSDSTFTAILIKKNGQWLFDTVRETDVPAAESCYDQLKELEWLVGEWHYKEGKIEVRTVTEWVANKNFLSRQYTVYEKGVVEHQGTQIVGWDPIQKSIRSWVFASDGSFGSGLWTRENKSWIARVSGILASGKKSLATQILTRVDNDHYRYEVVARSVSGQVLPNLEPVTMTRQTAKAEKE
jgi:uncharacterized protein (TIGR02246 family)